jgi:hypothetical protein
MTVPSFSCACKLKKKQMGSNSDETTPRTTHPEENKTSSTNSRNKDPVGFIGIIIVLAKRPSSALL